MNGRQVEQYINQFALSFPIDPTQEQMDLLHDLKNVAQRMRIRNYLEKEELDVFRLMMDRMVEP